MHQFIRALCVLMCLGVMPVHSQTTIDFDNFNQSTTCDRNNPPPFSPPCVTIYDQYAPQGLIFPLSSLANPMVWWEDTAGREWQWPPPHLTPSNNSYSPRIYARFVDGTKPQTWTSRYVARENVVVHGCGFDNLGTVTITWYDAQGGYLASQMNTTTYTGGPYTCEPFTAPGPVSGFRTEITCTGTYCEPGGYIIGAIQFGAIVNCAVPGSAHCDHNPAEDQDLGCNENGVGNPCDTGTGNKYQSESDYAGARLSFTRYYNSGLSDMDVGLGYGWTSTYHGKRIETYIDNTIQVRRADGRSYRFIWGGASPGWTRAGPEYDATLVQGQSGYTLTLHDNSVETYDSAGRILTETDRSGYGVTYSYSGNRLQQVTDTFGASLSFLYGVDGRLQSLVDGAGLVIRSYTYSGGNLTTATDSSNAVRTYVYENTSFPHRLTGIIDEDANRFATWGYDSSGRANLSEHAGGVERTTLSYVSGYSDVTTTVTDALGTAREYRLDLIGEAYRLKSISLPCEDCEDTAAKTYDWRGNVSSHVDFQGNRTCYAYDANRNLETVRVEGFAAAVTSCPANLATYSPVARQRKITTTWHATFPVPLTIVEANRTTTYTYDAKGNPLTVAIKDTSSSPNTTRTTTYTYNSYGQVLTENGPRTDVADVTTYTYYNCTSGYECGHVRTITNAAGQTTTRNTYSVHGLPLTITDPNGVVTTLTYDHRQRLATRTVSTEATLYEYWATGLSKKVTLPDGSYVLRTYDPAHRLIRVEDGLANRIEHTYDAISNRVSTSFYDPSNFLARTRSRVYNNLNQLWKEVGAAGTGAVTSVFAYDGNGNRTETHAPMNRNIINAYDEFSRLSQVTDAGGGVTKFTYDVDDNLASVTDPRGLVTSYAFNGFGTAKTVTSPNTGITSYTYDLGGNLKTSSDARNANATYTYDALNRPTSVVYRLGNSSTDQTLTFSYDVGTYGKGHLTGASDANHSSGWAHDAQGRVVAYSQTIGTVTKSLSYSFNAGRLATMTLPSGQVVTFGYNSNHEVASVAVGGVTILSDAMYEPFGPVRGWIWGNGTVMSRSRDTDGNIDYLESGAAAFSYSLDDAFRITGVTDLSTPSNSYTYGYDPLDRLTTGSKPGTVFGWTYDPNGNRLSQTGSGASTFSIAANSDRLNSTSGALSRTYSYDAAGNTTGYTTATAAYNNRGRMKTLTKAGVTTTYIYDALGRRIKQSGGAAGSVLYMYDDWGHLVGEYSGTGALIQETVWLGEIPVATLRPSGGSVAIYYVHTDHLNTPRRVTRPGDNGLMWAWSPSPFGADLPNENPQGLGQFQYSLRYPGQIYDGNAGLHYNYFRDYDPSSGRYMQSDPIGRLGGPNTYAYASSHPTLAIDPLGLADYTAGLLNCENGRLVPKVMPLQQIDVKCGVRRCVLEHEQQHVQDFRPFEKQLCRMFSPGQEVTTGMRTKAPSEVNAYQVSVNCLTRLKKDCSKECKPRLSELIQDAEAKRDYWRQVSRSL